jgi:hypothetical protein
MKTLTSFLFVASFVFAAAAFAWTRSHPGNRPADAVAPLHDTIKFYSVSTSAETRNGNTIYKVNGAVVTKAEYDKYHAAYEQMGNCKPCYMRTYSMDEKLLNEGDRYTDCIVGKWKEYYPDGNLKVEGQYKTDETGKWKSSKSEKWCSVKHGKWTYYAPGGTIDSVVNYADNVRVK